MPKAGRKRVERYSLEFKLMAVRLSNEPGLQVKAVAGGLDIHPMMLSRWRRQAREGVLRGTIPEPALRPAQVRELKRLQELEKAHALLLEEHDLLKKVIRFCSEREARSSRSSRRSGTSTR